MWWMIYHRTPLFYGRRSALGLVLALLSIVGRRVQLGAHDMVAAMRVRNRGSSRVTAVLGPTNTGKTHLAVERMLGHGSGIIGLPLRLLAREVYDRAVAAKGRAAVALVTGEEKIVPERAAYFVCTVESMPSGRSAEFVAVDEVQLAADPERGHVFTDRLLHARGRSETMFLGADTIRPLLRKLVPEAVIDSRPRFSTLGFVGHRKLSRMGQRSAVVAFSAEDVYAIAEQVRRHRGGAAVVMGALSPRTRNAQVALFESGDVDYLVATDAVGMGLNLNVEHVAFAAVRKFDGFRARRLSAAEIAQIAGRAGRHRADGTFGTTGRCPEIEPEVVKRVEDHRFEAVRSAFWRNVDLDFSSAADLIASLEAPPPREWRRLLSRPRRAVDQAVFAALSESLGVRTGDSVRMLWEVCQIPDYRKTLIESHMRLLGDVFEHVSSPGGVLPTDWLANRVARLDRTDGDIDTLAARIAHIRTWTYVCHHAGWVRDSGHWQERTREVEDRLSDALHECLTQRFVDRRTAALSRSPGDAELTGFVEDSGQVIVDGHTVGQMEGLRFSADRAESEAEQRLLRSAAQRTLSSELRVRAARLVQDTDDAFTLNEAGGVHWRERLVARLAPGPAVTRPRPILAADDLLDATARRRVQARIECWLTRHLAGALEPLVGLERPGLSGPARGIAFQLTEALGALHRHTVEEQISALTPAERKELGRRGVRFGAHAIHLPAMLRARRPRVCALLWAVHRGLAVLPPAIPNQIAFAADPELPGAYYLSAGYFVFGTRTLRIDRVERLANAVHRKLRRGPVAPDDQLQAMAGCKDEALQTVLEGLGFAARRDAGAVVFSHARKPRVAAKPPHIFRTQSAFAALSRHPAGQRRR
jgi:ATP-dependent RNA helicase SUPV3L1/SUV3